MISVNRINFGSKESASMEWVRQEIRLFYTESFALFFPAVAMLVYLTEEDSPNSFVKKHMKKHGGCDV